MDAAPSGSTSPVAHDFPRCVCMLHTAILFGPVPHGLVPLFSPIYYSGVHTTHATRLFLDVTRHMSRTHASTRV